MSCGESIPCIRDMVHQCAGCGNYFFELGKDNLCHKCTTGQKVDNEVEGNDLWPDL